MSNVNLTPDMNLPVPAVGIEPGPDWATDINNCLTIIDSHTHTPGSGAPITASAIQITTDFPFNNHAATTLQASVYTSQATLATLKAVYVIGNELFYNDGVGNAVQLTLNGSIVGTSGSITGLSSPASASYSGSTFIFQSNSLTAANVDAASYVLRNSTASSKGLTLSPPTAMAADYSIVLPSLPGAPSFVSLDSAGNMGASIAITGGITASNIANGTITSTQIATGGISTANLAASSVTTAKLAAASVAIANLDTTARESVYANAISTSLGNGTPTILVAPSVLSNTSSSYNPANGVYTAPFTGYLSVASGINVVAASSGNAGLRMRLIINSNAVEAIDTGIPQNSPAVGGQIVVNGYPVTLGDTVQIQAIFTGATSVISSGYITYSLR